MTLWHLALLSLVSSAVLAQNSTTSNSTQRHGSDRIGFKWDSTDRSTLVLIWNCLATIFTCTWTVIHLDISSDRYTTKQTFFRKLRWMIFTIIVPAITFGMAFAQFMACRSLRREIRKNGYRNWSMAQSFYAVMGGYRVQHGTWSKLLTPEGVAYLLKRVPDADLLSKSDVEKLAKADGFAKLVACIQAGWLIVHSIARATQNLPISELEIATLSLVANAFVTYLLWWEKPYDVNQRMVFTLDDTSAFNADFLGGHSPYFHHDDKLGLPTVEIKGRYFLYGGMTFFGVICGGVHCFAWNFEFASPKEQLLWRVCSLLVTTSGVPGGIVFTLITKSERIFDEGSWWMYLQHAIIGLCMYAYLAGRLVLIFLAFYSLRSEPVGVYESVAWINYVPHLG